jgi:hypothetical protein
MTDVRLSDEFDHPQGRFVNYDTYDTEDRFKLYGQKHVDIRSFSNDPLRTEWRMVDFNQTQVGELNNQTMQSFTGTRLYRQGESWTKGIVGRQSDRRNWHGISIDCQPGTTVSESVVAYTLDEIDGDQVTNLVLNPSFETGLTDWTGQFSTRTASDGWSAIGKRSMRIQGSATAPSSVSSGAYPIAFIPVTAGKTYSARAMINVIDNHAPGVRLTMEWYNDSNVKLSSTSGAYAIGLGIQEVTVTGVAPAGATKITLTVYGVSPTVLYTNLVINPSGETNTTGWVVTGNRPVEAIGSNPTQNADARVGSFSISRTMIPSDHAGEVYAYSAPIACAPGDRFAFRQSLKMITALSIPVSTLRLRARYSNSGGAYLGEGDIATINNPATETWHDLEGILTVPATVGGGTPATLSVMIVGTLSSQGRMNAVRNPSVETNTTDLNSFTSSLGGTGGSSAVTRMTTDAAPGAGTSCASWSVTTQTGGTGGYSMNIFHQGTQPLATLQAQALGGLATGHIAFARASFKVPTALPAGANVELVIRCHDTNGNFINNIRVSGTGSSAIISDPAANTWHDLFGTITVPTNTVYAVVRIQINGLAAATTYNDIIRTDKVLITRVATVTTFPAYGDGGTSGWVWAGTAHASKSGIPLELRTDRAMVVPVGTGITQAPTYFDGSTTLARWTGTAHASTSEQLDDTPPDFYLDAVSLIEGSQPRYLDGDQPRFKWMGTPHASTSTGPFRVEAERIDLLTDFKDEDYISLALPDFPLASVNLTNSYVDFTSNPAGDFVEGPMVSVALSESLTPLVAGDSEFRVLREELLGINLGEVTGVRLRITATAQCTVRAMGLRLLARSWKYAPHDQDTRLNILKKTVAPDGSITRPFDFNIPTLFRAGEPAGVDDPKPINGSFAVSFYTGQKLDTNSVSLYFREGRGDFTQQIDINGLPQDNLNGDPQPNYVNQSFRGRTQTELNFYQQTDLQSDTQIEIERTVDPTIRSFLSARLTWTASTTTIALVDSEGTGYSFGDVPPLAAGKNYIFIVEVQDNTLRGQLYTLDFSGTVQRKSIFDTGIVIDENNYVRRRGRYGWYTNLQDGDAYVEGIRTRRQVYAELDTAPFESITPVEGAELYLNGTKPIEYVKTLHRIDFDGSDSTVTRDTERTLSGISHRVDNPGTKAPQGIQTNLIDFNDFSETEISFDIYYPSSALDAGQNIEAYLGDDRGRIIPLQVGTILPDRWFKVRLAVTRVTAQTGRYRLNIVQSTGGPPSTWWVDNVSVTERVLSFYARAALEDPWGDAKIDWVPFKDRINAEATGVQFNQRGKHLQVHAMAHRPSARIDNFKVVPRYSQLGRFVWEEDELYNPQAPVSVYSVEQTQLTVEFDGTDSYDPDGSIIHYRWNFGDGSTAVGPVARHTYPQQGVYRTSLVVTDRNGLQNESTLELSVSAF